MGVLLGLFGAIAFGFGIVAIVVGASLGWIYGHLALGAALLLYAAATSMGDLRERLQRGSSRRTARYGSNLAAQTVLALGIIGIGAWLSVRHSVHWDWTEARVHSLSPASLDLLGQIPDGDSLQVLAFFTPGSETGAKDLLDRYSYRSDRVHVQVIDPRARPALAQRFEVRTNGVILVCHGECEKAKATARVTEANEEKITSAIRSVISKRRRIYVLTGHGEAALDDTGENGLSELKKALDADNLQVEPLLLANRDQVPDDADAVLVPGPDRSLFDKELDRLGSYLRGGGRVGILIDPLVVTHLEERLARWGVQVGHDVIVDQRIQLFAGPQLGVEPLVTDYGAHPITKGLSGRPTLFPLARSVRPVKASGDAVELAMTGPSSWAETDLERFSDEGVVSLDAGDTKGPVPVAVAEEMGSDEGSDKEARRGRLVVFGNSSFARNRHVHEVYNSDLILNAIHWLVGEEKFITIDRKLPRASTAMMTVQQFRNFRYMTLFIAPELLLAVGITVWWRRRT
ncbi:MAG: GldG family protein [Myxococcota bacterium]